VQVGDSAWVLSGGLKCPGVLSPNRSVWTRRGVACWHERGRPTDSFIAGKIDGNLLVACGRLICKIKAAAFICIHPPVGMTWRFAVRLLPYGISVTCLNSKKNSCHAEKLLKFIGRLHDTAKHA